MSRLLIVDDEVAILDALQDVLSAEGYEVRTALNGAEGLRQVAQGRPDLVLLDLMMPVMDGHEVLQRLKEEADTRDIPIIVMSAGRVRREELRGSRFLPKPFDLEALLQAVADELARAPRR